MKGPIEQAEILPYSGLNIVFVQQHSSSYTNSNPPPNHHFRPTALDTPLIRFQYIRAATLELKQALSRGCASEKEVSATFYPSSCRTTVNSFFSQAEEKKDTLHLV